MIKRFLKIFEYMYILHKRNIKQYFIPMANAENDALTENSIHWVGHATTLINLSGIIVVTDPVCSLNLGQMKRLVKPSINLKDIKIDYILISHRHMDHLDFNTLKLINKDAVIIVPSNHTHRFKSLGFKNIIVLEHNETYKDSNILIESLRAEHDGKRYYFGPIENSNSYLIKRNDKKIFFAGDTAYTTAYKDIDADIALMPVGCYKPDEYQEMHCSPIQSYEMFKMTKAKYMIPIHYKTFILAQDEDLETVNILKNLNDDCIKILEIGNTFNL